MSPGQGGRETGLARVMRLLLAVFCIATAVVFGVLAAGRALDGAAGGAAAQATVAVLATVFGVVLLARGDWPLRQLRAVELVLFAALAVYLGGQAYVLGVADLAGAGPAAPGWDGTVLRFALLMTAYGVFVPNRPVRAAAGVAALAATPLLSAALIWARHPELRDAFGAAVAGRGVDSAALLGVSAIIALFAAYVIDKYFTVAYEARRATFYDLEQRIGSGGMGEVWRARHRALARPAAVKLIREDRIDGADHDAAVRLMLRFEREAMATASLRSPHTVEVFDAGVTADGHFYYAMEYLEGLDLETLVATHGPLPAERVVHLLLQACDSLTEAHDRGLTHRDIKPANLHVSRLGPAGDHLKLLDFGLVKEEKATIGSAEVTVDDAATGTPAYMAPEIATQGTVDGRTDIYALGCVAYWLLTGKTVFEAEGGLAVIVEHVKTEPVRPSQRVDLDIPPALEQIVMKCLEKAPDDRFQTTRELAGALEELDLARRWSSHRAVQWWERHVPATAA